MLKPTPSNDSVYFHQSCRPRHDNPTFLSSHMTDSLTILNPPHEYTKTLIKDTSYKQSFDSTHSENVANGASRTSQYAKFSKAAFQKNRSMMSNYGATILRQSNRHLLN